MILENLQTFEDRHKELSRLIENNINDYQMVAELSKEKSDLDVIVSKANLYRNALKAIEETKLLLASDEEEIRTLANEELARIQVESEKLESELMSLLVPKDPRDKRNVIMEIRAGTGGDEAALFAADLFRLYSHYAEQRKWEIDILSQNDIGIGGLKEIVFIIKGKRAYSRLKYESGVHRVQRIPVTESSGRIHTSTVTVAVLAEVEDVDIQIPESDLRIDIYRSAGAGGQNVQKNATAVRLTHIPSGIVVACQDERSQLQNRMRAMGILRAKLYELEEQKRIDERDAERKSQVGSGERSEKIRTYNYPQSRVTDHRINISSHNLPSIMEGNLDVFIDELILNDESSRLMEVEKGK